MQVFLSWSGPRSQQVAQLLSDWLPRVIQSLKPWISTKDIQKGSLWAEIIGDELKNTTTGIICLTKENKDRPWILFEAGALAKGLSSNRVCTLLIDLGPSQIVPPLSQFNHTRPSNKEDMLHLLQTLNDRLKENKLTATILENALEVHWSYFSEELSRIIKETPDQEKIPDRAEKDILKEILENTRNLNSRVIDLESVSKVKKELDFSKESKSYTRLSDMALQDAQILKSVGKKASEVQSILFRDYSDLSAADIFNIITVLFNSKP